VIEAAGRHDVAARCVWVDVPLAQAQVNLVERLLDRFGELPTPEQLREAARHEPGLLLPTSQMRTLRQLEPPSLDEGFAAVEHVPFVRATSSDANGAVFVAAAALAKPGWREAIEQGGPKEPHLLFDWLPDATPDALADAVAVLSAEVTGPVESAVCPHPGGPPSCWCRPPLPGLALAFARRNGVAPSRSVLIGSTTTHRTLATTLGARYVPV
jgi:hypothetical protein